MLVLKIYLATGTDIANRPVQSYVHRRQQTEPLIEISGMHERTERQLRSPFGRWKITQIDAFLPLAFGVEVYPPENSTH